MPVALRAVLVELELRPQARFGVREVALADQVVRQFGQRPLVKLALVRSDVLLLGDLLEQRPPDGHQPGVPRVHELPRQPVARRGGRGGAGRHDLVEDLPHLSGLPGREQRVGQFHPHRADERLRDAGQLRRFLQLKHGQRRLVRLPVQRRRGRHFEFAVGLRLERGQRRVLDGRVRELRFRVAGVALLERRAPRRQHIGALLAVAPGGGHRGVGVRGLQRRLERAVREERGDGQFKRALHVGDGRPFVLVAGGRGYALDRSREEFDGDLVAHRVRRAQVQVGELDGGRDRLVAGPLRGLLEQFGRLVGLALLRLAHRKVVGRARAVLRRDAGQGAEYLQFLRAPV